MAQLALLNPLLDGLNREQAEAVEAIRGPVLVIAAPGSGKTTVLTRRLAHLLQEGVSPEAIMAVTFTKKAATEMNERLAKLLGSKDIAKRLTIGTFHSIGLRLLEGNYRKLGYTVDKPHLLLPATQRALFQAIVREQGTEDLRFEDLATYISQCKSRMILAQDVKKISADPDEGRLAQCYAAYQERLFKQNLIDFDDQILLPVRLLEQCPEVRDAIQARYQYILVDEYQDTNRAQYLWLKHLAAPQNNLFAVGDDAQGIYGFRAADIDNILHFCQDYPEARRIILSTNYRSAPPIVELANNLIRHNARQMPKTIQAIRPASGSTIRKFQALDSFSEAEEVVNKIKEVILSGTRTDEIAILYRTHAQSAILIDLLIEQGIPFSVKRSGNFYERSEIQEMLAFLYLASREPHPLSDLALENFLRTMGLSRENLSVLKFEAEKQSSRLWDAASSVDRLPISTLAQKGIIKHVLGLVGAWRRHQGPISDLFMTILEQVRLRGKLEKDKSEEGRQKLDSLAVFHEQIKRWSPPSLPALFRIIDRQLSPPKVTKKQKAVQLMTIHSSKGLEWDAVFLVGLEEGTLPYQLSIDDFELAEERRLCYVAITRARTYLHLSYARTKSTFGDRKDLAPSRFLTEMNG